MTIKDRLAATLINYWYVIERGLGTHRLKKVPHPLDVMKDLDGLAKLTPAAIQELTDTVAAYNSRGFSDNLEHILSNDKSIAEFGAEAVCQKLKATFRAAIQMSNELGAEVEALRISLNATEQSVDLKRAIERLPQMVVGDSRSSLNIDASCAVKNFYRSLFDVETDFMAEWNAAKVLLFVHKSVMPKLDADTRKEIVGGRAYLILRDCKLIDGSFDIGERFEIVETPSARDARLIRERLEIALKRRFRPIKSIGVDGKAVVYSFTDENTLPLKIELDVVTHW